MSSSTPTPRKLPNASASPPMPVRARLQKIRPRPSPARRRRLCPREPSQPPRARPKSNAGFCASLSKPTILLTGSPPISRSTGSATAMSAPRLPPVFKRTPMAPGKASPPGSPRPRTSPAKISSPKSLPANRPIVEPATVLQGSATREGCVKVLRDRFIDRQISRRQPPPQHPDLPVADQTASRPANPEPAPAQAPAPRRKIRPLLSHAPSLLISYLRIKIH